MSALTTLSEIIVSTCRAVAALKAKRYTEYPAGTPHRSHDKDDWARIGIEASTVDSAESAPLPQQSVNSSTLSQEVLDRYKRASRFGYSFVDRGVSRAQGLLQFNSLVLAALIFTPALFQHPTDTIFEKLVLFILVMSLLALVLSSFLSGCCLWIVWFRPIDHLEPQREAPLVWRVWVDRALLFNMSLLLAAPAFFGVTTALLLVLVKRIFG